MGATKLMTAAGGGITLDAASTASDKTITVPARTGNMAVDGPAFMATDTTQSCSHNTNVKLTFTSEQFDTNSCYDTTNSRFTPNVAGYYFVFSFFGGIAPATQNQAWTAMVYKNGSLYGPGSSNNAVTTRNGLDWGSFSVRCQQLVYCNGTTDYIEIYAYQYDYSTGTAKNAIEKVFGAHMVRAA